MRSFNRLNISQSNTRGKRSDFERERTQAKGERAVFDTRKRAAHKARPARSNAQTTAMVIRRMSKPLAAFAFVLLTAMLIVSLIGMSNPVVVSAADSATFNNIVNANIGMHPKWIQGTCDSVEEGGVGDSYTVKHTVWHVDVDDNDPIMEKSPAYTFKGDEEVSDEFADRYNLQRGNEVVFNIEDPDTAAKVWADAVAFAQTLGTPTPLADPYLAGATPANACPGGGKSGSADYENHRGFRVGTNTDERNMYKGNFFIENDDGALGQYITVRLQTDWVAKAITANVPNGDPIKVAPETSDYVKLNSSATQSVSSTTFNYILTTKQDSNDGYLKADKIDAFNRTQDAGGYTLSYDIASNSFNYDGNSASVFNDNCAFSYGRINVPTGVYIVLDLNGHTIDRALTGYNKVSTTNNGDMFGSVIHINSKARLEICDTSAYENASSSRVQRYEKVTENSEGAVAVEGYGSKKIWKLVAAETLIPFNTLNPTNNQHKDYIVVTNHKGTITGGYNSGTADRKGSYGAGVLNEALQPEMQHRGGAVNLSPWADLVMHSGTIYGNKTPSESGGAFYQRSKAAVTIFDGYVIQNVANSAGVSSLGGGSGCPFTMYGGVLGYNTVNGNGGALALGVCSYANFHGGEIVYNHAGGTGGALNLSGNTLGILDSVTITGNTSTGNGGGVYVPKQVAAVDELKRVPNGQGRAFKFRGSLQIYGNKHGNNEENVYLEYGLVGTITSGTSRNDFDMSGAAGGVYVGKYIGQPTIAIGGPMFANGIVARVGITLGSTNTNVTTQASEPKAPKTQNCTIFTSDYGKYNPGVNAFNYFFSDKNSYNGIASARVVNSANAGSADNEGKIGNDTTAEQTITWVIKGTGVTSTENEHPYTITAADNSVKTEGAQGGISYTYEGLTCEFGMLKVTSVEAHTGGTSGPLVAKWEITSSGKDTYNIVNTFTETNFRFKLGDWDYVDGKSTVADSAGRKGTTATHAAIHATDNTISYAGEYSFLVSTEGNRYVNPSFKIRINQVGVEVDRELYYKGQDVKKLKWTKNINWDGSKDAQGSPTFGGKGSPQAQLGNELDQPYFIYSGDYYYPILSADWNRATVLSLYNPYTGNTSSVSKKDFTGYVMKFTYANSAYFGTDKAVEFGEHSGGGVEYQTMHRKPGEIAGIGTYVPGVMHAGMYQVSFISSRSVASADAASQDYNNTGVYFAANNFAFSSKINLYVEPASAEVQLTPEAAGDFTYRGNTFADSEILLFDNTSDTSVVPHTDSTATMAYYLFEDLKYFAGIYDVRTDLYYTFDKVQNWEANRPLGKGEAPIEGRPQFDEYSAEEMKTPPKVTFKGDPNDAEYKVDTDFNVAQHMDLVGTDDDKTIPKGKQEEFEKFYQQETIVNTTGKLVYIIDTSSFKTAQKYKQGEDPSDRTKGSNPLDARRYVVLIVLTLEGGYDDYDYVFDQDPVGLVGLGGESQYFWAFEFDVKPAEIDPYELIAGSASGASGKNTSVAITKDEYYKNVSYAYEYTYVAEGDSKTFEKKNFSKDANLPTVTFGTTVLELGGDYDVEYSSFAEEQKDGSFNYVDASVGLDSASTAPAVDGYKFGDYNLAVKITFGGTNKNYVNTPSTAGSADGKGTAYEDESGAFYIYFRIIPVIVTASANLSYTYDGGSYDRGRHLDAGGDYSEWYESIFFLAQDSITTSQELIANQKENIDTWHSQDGSRTLKDLWGGSHGKRPAATGDENSYTDKEFYQQRYYVSNVNVQYTNSDFIDNGIKLGVGMYAFQTGSPNYQVSSYHLMTKDYDAEKDIGTAPKDHGVMWLLTVGNTQTFVSTQQDKQPATNFIVSAQSYLDVNITQKDITADDVKVTLNGEAYDSAHLQEYPYAGYEYRPAITLSYDVQRPTQVAGPHTIGTVDITTISISTDGSVKDDKNYDSFITYSNNVQTSTDVLPASVIITAASTNRSSFTFSQNFYNTRSLEFKIIPAHIKVTIKDGTHEDTYNRREHEVSLQYENTTSYDGFEKLLPEGFGESVAKPLPIEQTEITVMYGKVGTDNIVPMVGDRRDFVSTAPINAGRYRVAVHLNSANFIYIADDYKKNTDPFVMDSVDGSKDILTYNDRFEEEVPDGLDTDLIINPAIAYIGPGAPATTDSGHEIVNVFTYNRTNQVPTVLSTNICEVSFAKSKWEAHYDSNVVPASSSGDYTVTYANTTPDETSPYAKDGFADAGTYWMILDMQSENFIWGGYNVEDALFTHTELSDKRLAVQYTIAPSEVLLKPNDSISGAKYPEGQGTLHFTFDGTKHEVAVSLSSNTLTPLSAEYQLNEIVFVGDASSFVEKTEEKYMSIYAGTYYFTVTFTDAAKKNYKWSASQDDWNKYNSAHEGSVVIKQSAETNTDNKIVFVDPEAGTVTITYTIDPAKVEIESIDSRLYNRGEQGDPETDPLKVNFKNSIDTNSQVPTSYDITFAVSDAKNQWLYQNYDASIEGSAEKAPNAKLGDNDLPYYAGNYDATITLTGDDANNFRLVQKESYTTNLNIENASKKEEGKTVDYSDKVASDGKSAVALFVIEALGVYATQTVSSVMFDNKDHFNGDPYGITEGGRYGGEGPWTISFSALSGITSVEGISYNISFENDKYLVIIKMGGYSHGAVDKTLDPDAIYLQVKGTDEKAKKINTSDNDDDIKAAFAQIQKLGLFTNADTYDYKLTFEFANFYFAGEIGGEKLLPKEKPLKFTVTPATIALGTLANKTFNNEEQDADFTNDSFVAVGEAKFDESIYNILKGYNGAAAGSGFTFTYELPAPEGNSKLGESGKPFNAGSYTVKVTLTSKNFRFSGEETESTMSFTIDPFDISTLKNADDFKVTLPSVRYTGMPMKTYLSQVEVKIGEGTVTLVLLSSAATDGKLQLGKEGYDFNITSYDSNVNVGEATAHIVGGNNFTGELTRNFTILKRQVHVNINDNMGNVYGVNPNSGIDKPSNLGDVRDVDWSFDGEGAMKSADDLTRMIDASVNMTYGSDDAAIQTAIAAFEKLNGESADKFIYEGDNLYVTLSIFRGSYNGMGKGAEHQSLLVGKWRIVGGATNANYDVTFSGKYSTSGATDTEDGDDKYGCYEVVQREISITPADLGIVYGNTLHTYNGNEQEGKYLYWTATSDYAGGAILSEDLSTVTAGITLTIEGTEGHMTGNWLNVGTYKIKVNADEIGKLESGNATDVKQCYKVTGIGTWIDAAGYAITSASEAVTIGTGGTYTVTPRDIKVKIAPNTMGYEYNAAEPNAERDILKYMLETAKKPEGGGNYAYEDLVSLVKDETFLDFAEGESWEILKLKFIKDAGVDAITYSVSPSYTNDNYTVTFEGTSNSVTITPRKIVVHINNQEEVYGEDAIVGMNEGQDANWYAMLSKDSTYWNDDLYDGDDKLTDRIKDGHLDDDNLNITLTKEFGANVGIYYLSGAYSNNNYVVVWEGEWTSEQSTTSDKGGTDPTDKTAGIYKITPRPVTVTVYGQSGVYGGNQNISIGATENTHWQAEQGKIGNSEKKGVVNNDSLGISITIVYDSLNKAGQLNVGWYSLRVSYTNANYTVTFESDNSNLNGAQYVDEYDSHNVSDVTEHREGDAVTSYDVSNAYYIYARILSLNVSAQSVYYNGQEPSIQQNSEGNSTYWNVVSVVNGEGTPVVAGDLDDFNKSVELYVVAPTEGDPMYDVWKKWGMWSAGSYNSGKSGIKAQFKDAGDDENRQQILKNYRIQDTNCAILRIFAAEITVTHKQQESTYNNDAPTITKTRDSYDITGTTYSSRRWNGNSFEEEPTKDDNSETVKNLLKFVFTYDDGDGKPETKDYGAGRHLIQGAWDGEANPNYTVTFNAGVYNIIKRDLVITILPQYAIYGETLLSADDAWWIDDEMSTHGEKKLNPKYWTVKVTNYNKDYSGGESIYWVNEKDRLDLDIKPVIEAQQGANAGNNYIIGGTWNSSNDDYNVTFETATYTIYRRAIIVNINDQGGVYGGNSFGTAVDQSMGEGPDSGGWYVVGFDSTKQQELCEGHDCGTPNQPFVVRNDNLNIVLTLGNISTPGEYDIEGSCGNTNYEVTWQGSRNKGDVAVGKFGITARKVIVRIEDQSSLYGEGTAGNPAHFEQNRYSAIANNDLTNRDGFIKADNVVVVLSVTVSHAGAGDYNQAGKYAITVKIYEGYNSDSDKGTLIYSSLVSDNKGGLVAKFGPSSKYEITLEGNGEDASFDSNHKEGDFSGKTGVYEITKKDLYVTVADKSSIYGESLERLTFTTSGAMTAEQTEIENLIHLDIEERNYSDWDSDSLYLCAGNYNITATLDDSTINNNYNVVFRTQNGADYKTDGGEKITAMYTVTKRMLAINVTYLNSVYGEALESFSATLSPVGNITGEPILQIDRDHDPDRPLGIKFEIVGASSSANQSTTGYLKVGVYPIIGSWESETYFNYDVQFTGVWTEANTVTWLEQANENKTMYQEEKDGAHGALDRKAGVYTVSKRPIDIRLGVDEPASEYGDEILHFADEINTDKTWGIRYEESTTGRGRVSRDDKTDAIVFEMTTSARQGDSARTYPITVKEGSNVGGDNANYNITFIEGTYTIKPREMTVTLTAKDPKIEEGFSCAVDVYGTTYDQEAKFTYAFTRTHPQGADNSFYNGEKIDLVITPWKNAMAQDAKLTETGFYPVGTYSLELSAKNDSNYSFKSMEGINVRYKVTPRPLTIYINEQSSVYGEDIVVHQGQGKGAENGWHVVDGKIVQGNGATDDLGIRITKAAGDRWAENGYMLTATAKTASNYSITWQGNWNDGTHGTYTIQKRLILIRIHNQYSIYGENIKVSSETSAWEVVDPLTIADSHGKTYYTLIEGQTPGITLNIFTQETDGVKTWYVEGLLPRGEYRIDVQEISNNDYDVEIEDNYLPAVSDTSHRGYLKDDFSKDFGNPTSKDTIEVVNPAISEDLANANFATYFVTIRPVTIRINDQSGVYGDYLTLNQAEGALEAYNIALGANTTNTPFIGDYKATFDLVTTAIEGSDISGKNPVGKAAGWSLDAKTYPIFGAEYHVFVGGKEVTGEKATNLSHNYQFNFEGAYTGEETYPSGTTFHGRAGVYTVIPRQVTLTANNASEVYGGNSEITSFPYIPTLNQSGYNAIVSNSKTPQNDKGETHGAILDGDLAKLKITLTLAYEEANLSAAKALKVGHYVINLTYTHNDNYDITAIDGDFEVMVRSAAIIIGQRAASATYLASIPSQWTNADKSLYTRSNVLDGDVIVFTMSTEAEQGNDVASDYVLSGTIGDSKAGDNANYSITFTNGTFEITRKQVEVKIIDQSSEYGNDVTVNVKGGWELPADWNKNPGDGYTNNDNADELGIKLSTSATRLSGVGDYQISGQYEVSSEVGKNYDLQFVGSWNSSNVERTDGNGGTLTIFARELIVVIKPQAQEYRSSYALSPNEWFAWRKGHKATWNGEETNDEGGVLGGDDKLGDLRIELKRGGATDKDKYGENTNMDTYFGTYAIVGSSTASNYDITFAYERAEQPNFNYGEITKSEDGVFDITAYKITIKVLNLGINDADVKYGAYKFGAALTNEQGVIWEYAQADRDFLPTELGYLSFSLGGDVIACDAYAFVGGHPIVGYWGKGLDKNANDYRMQFNYEVTFEGEWSSAFNTPKDLGYESLYKNEGDTAYSKCGIIQISPADITSLSYEQEYQEGEANGSHWHGNNWTREAVFSGDGADNPKHSMAVGAADFAFAGDVLFGGREGEQFGGLANTVLQGKASVSYSNLTHNGAAVTWNDASVAPEEQAVGVWGVTVTVKAPYHNEATFTLTLDISRLDITIYLTSEKIHFDYGVYKLVDDGIISTDKSDFNEVLKKLLFGYNEAGENLYLDKKHEGGAIVGAEDLGKLDDIMKYLLGSPEVKLSIATRRTDASSGGYLNVNSLGYALTIDSGENMSIHFGSDYYNVFIDARPLHADWRSDPKTDPQTLEDFDKVAYIYTFDNNEISVVPHVMRDDILAGDSVLIDDDLSASIFDYALYKLQNGAYVAIGDKTVLDVGTYKALIRVNISPTSNNVDIGNYTTPEDWVYIVVRPRVITVVVENQSSEYDEYSPTLDQHAWYIKTGDPSKDVTDGDHPDKTPTGEPLSALGITLGFVDKDVLNAGKYEIRATYTSVNYEIVFEGAFGAESGKMGTSGIFEITKREVRVKVNNFSFVYGNDIPDNLADDANGYTCIHLVNGEERPNEIAVLPRDSVSLNIAIDGVQRTQTGYVKAGEYNVKLSYSNSNYNIHFADSEGHPEGAGSFSVKVNVAKAAVSVSIHGRQVRYGDLRPEMPENYTITGLASADNAFYEEKGLKRPEFINFIINNADTGTPLKEFDAGVREELMFDEVGVYIIQGSINELAEDYADIGVNYDVAFSGEWTAYGRYLTDQYVGKASKYEVVPRDIGITIGDVESQYGDALTDEEIPFVLQQGANNKLAGDDKLEDLLVAFHTEAILYVNGQRRTNKVGTYRIEEPVAGNKNYNILTYSVGHYEITPREIIIKLQDMTRPYGDDHAAHVDGFGYGNGWTAERFGDKLGAGIAYDDDDIKQEVKLGTSAGEHSAVGDYDLIVTTMPYDSNYSVKEVVNGKYTVAKRRVALNIDSQEGEYGDSHALGSHFNFTLLSTDSNKPTLAVAFETDAINLLELFFTDEITARTPVGDYRIDARFSDGNYDVTITGKYLDGDRQYGKYTVKPRDIVITLLGTQQSEYGDPVKASSEFGEGWTIGRPEGKGGNALVNDDTITLELVVLDELAKVVDSTYSAGKYAVVVKSSEISSNYNVLYKTQEGGAYEGDVYGHADDVKAVYTILPRDITVEFGGESEYGDPVEVRDISFRTNGKEGEGIVNGDKLGFAWEWGAQGDPTNGGAKFADVGQYAIRLKDISDANAQKARHNYNITASDNSFYHVVPRKVTVRVKDINKTYGDAFEDPNDRREELLEVSRATQGATGDAILNNDIRFFSLSVVNGDNILLTDGIPVNAGVYNFKLVYTDNNKNYDISVVYGHYTIAPKPVTVNIDSKTSKYSDDIVALTYGEVKGLIGDDDLNIALSVLWLDEELGLEWHNAGVYAIKGVWDNPNYAVTFKGALGEFGAYTVEKADNMFTKEYNGNGTVYLGDDYRNGDLPTALWGNDGLRLEYYLDEAMTQKAEFGDILDAAEGTYYVKAIVDEGANWTDAVTSFTVNVVDAKGFSDGMDITAYVCVFASQFIILACALIFIRRKKEKNKKTNTSKAGN